MGLSVALCTYNGEKFLAEQLESIVTQTVLPDEVVVCDDRSTDRTAEILQTFAGRAPFPVRVHLNERNLGSTRNFERAIGLCSGDIIALSDQDDVWKRHKLERILEVFDSEPNAGYVFSDAELVDEELRPLNRLLWEAAGFSGETRALFTRGEQLRCLLRKQFVTGATMAFRRSVGEMAMPFPTEGCWIHDGWIVLLATATGAVGVPIDEPLIDYRQHAKQQLGAPDTQRELSLVGMYRSLRANSASLFAAWEAHGLEVLHVKECIYDLQRTHPSTALSQSLACFEAFETHFATRRKILTSRGVWRYRMILLEALSGRYGLFSDSWRSIFRDFFL